MIHRFLLAVAKPAMRCPVDPIKSLHEVIRVAKYEAAIMAVQDDCLIGTMGIVKHTWWYGDGDFLTDRWNFVLPHHWHGEAQQKLLAEAEAIADQAGLEFIHQGRLREKGRVKLMMPRIYRPESNTLAHEGAA